MTGTKSLQYKQIDFLRLFRLCKNLGVVKRKRKMPSQYDRASHVNSSCSKLFKSFLTGIFEDSDICVDGRRNTYTIQTPGGSAERLRFLSNNLHFIADVEEFREAVTKYNIICSISNNFVVPPHRCNFDHFIVSTLPEDGGRYNDVATNMSRIHVARIARPKEEYYRCASACLEFKEVWNEHVGALCAFVDARRDRITQIRTESLSAAERAAAEARDIAMAEIDRQRLEQQATRHAQEAAAQATRRTEEARRAAVLNQAEATRNARRSEAQTLFNGALRNRRNA